MCILHHNYLLVSKRLTMIGLECVFYCTKCGELKYKNEPLPIKGRDIEEHGGLSLEAQQSIKKFHKADCA